MKRRPVARSRFAFGAAVFCALAYGTAASHAQQTSSRRAPSSDMPPVPAPWQSMAPADSLAPPPPSPLGVATSPAPEAATAPVPQSEAPRTFVRPRTVERPEVGFGQPPERPRVYPREGLIRAEQGEFRVARLRQPPEVGQPDVGQPDVFQPDVFQPDAGAQGVSGDLFPGLAGLEQATGQTYAPGSQLLDVAAPDAPPSTDAGELLAASNSIQGVAAQRRSQSAFTPVIRGFKEGQIYTQSDGAYWLPARQDLDTIISKLDPTDIQDIVVVTGPYGLRYGPAFSYLDVIRTPTPRYDSPEIHNRLGLTYLANGDQFYLRDAIYGGGQTYGYRFNYGHRLGSDYLDGDGDRIPSSYGNSHALGDLSYDLSPYQRIDLSYQRLDIGDTEYYLQVFNLDVMVTNGWNVRLTDEDPTGPWTRLTLDGWANRTWFDGSMAPWAQTRITNAVSTAPQLVDNNGDPGEPLVPGPGLSGDRAIINGITDGVVLSSGGRLSTTFGELEDPHLNTGADFRYIQQSINENYTVTVQAAADQAEKQRRANYVFGQNPPGTDPFTFHTNLPRSWLRDTGIFAEYAMPFGYWTPTFGARVDFVNSVVRESELRPNSQLIGSLEQNNTLYSFYLTNELELDRNWTGNISFGQGQRPATLTERYADGLFLSVAQSGFTRVIGFPALANERNWQIDTGLNCDFDFFRAGINGYYAFVLDYITFADNIIVPDNDPSGARLLNYMNTRLATLAGFALNCEFDLTDRVTPFATMYYIEGRDMVIHQPLPQIPPLDTRLGFRLHDPDGGRFWGIDFFARVVDNQDRVAYIRQGTSGAVVQLEQPTAGFTTFNMRGYYNWSPTMNLIAGIDNVFDRNYLEHLDVRLPAQSTPPIGSLPAEFNYRPGFTPYAGFEWIF